MLSHVSVTQFRTPFLMFLTLFPEKTRIFVQFYPKYYKGTKSITEKEMKRLKNMNNIFQTIRKLYPLPFNKIPDMKFENV